MILKLISLYALIALPLLQAETKSENNTTHKVFQFENEHVRVWKTIIMPHQPLKMHRHDCGRVVVGLRGGSHKTRRDGRNFRVII